MISLANLSIQNKRNGSKKNKKNKTKTKALRIFVNFFKYIMCQILK